MTDEDIREEARVRARRAFPRQNARHIRMRRRVMRFYTARFRREREDLIRICASEPDRKWGGVLYGPHVKGLHGSMVDTKQESNMIRGLCKRIGKKMDYDVQEIRRFGQFVQDFIERHYEPLPSIEPTHEFLDEAWLDGSKYNRVEKAKFHKLFDEWQEGNFEEKRLLECKVFIKREITPETKEPRIISSRTDMFKAVVAPYIRKVEDAVYDEHFIKHCHPDEVQRRVRRVTDAYQYLYETDYSSFESSFSIPYIREVETRLFRHMLRNNPKIWSIVEKACSGSNVLVCPWMWVEMPGSRMSGEMWTSLANGFSNMMMIHYMASRVPADRPVDYDFLVEGDDGLIGTTTPLDTSIVRDLGFTLTLREGAHLNDLSFCGMIVGPDRRLYCHPDNTLIKFGRTTDPRIVNARKKPWFTELLKSDLRTRALSMSVYCGSNPVMVEVINKSLELTRGASIRMEALDYWESDILEVQKYWNEDTKRLPLPPAESYEFVEDIFGVDTKTLKTIGMEVDSQEGMCFSIRHRLEDRNGGIALDHYAWPRL